MHLYLGMKNPYNRDALLYGTLKNMTSASFQDRENLLNRVIGRLSEKHRRAAELIAADFDENRARIEERMIATMNRGFDSEAFYVPVVRESFRSGGPDMLDASDALAVESAGNLNGVLAKMNDGFTVSRLDISPENQQPIRLGLYAVWYSQMQRQEHVAAMSGYAQDVASLLYSKDPAHPARSLGSMIADRFGAAAWKALISNENVMIRDGLSEASDGISDFINMLAARKAEAQLAWNLATSFKQIGSAARFLPFSGGKQLLLAVKDFSANPNRFLRAAYALDPTLRTRSGDAILQQLRGKTAPYMRHAFTLLGALDRAVSSVGFVAVYNANLENGVSHDRSVSEARRAVNMTQNAATAKDKPYLWKQHAALRSMMMFTGDAAKRWNISTYDMAVAMRSENDNRIQQTLYTALGWAMDAAAVYAIGNGLPGGDDEDSLAEWMNGAFVGDGINSVPLVGPALLKAYEAVIKNSRAGMPIRTIFEEPVDRIRRNAGRAWDGLTGEEAWYYSIWYMIEAMAYVGGEKRFRTPHAPVTMGKRVINALGMAADGEVYDAVLHGLFGQRVQSERILR